MVEYISKIKALLFCFMECPFCAPKELIEVHKDDLYYWECIICKGYFIYRKDFLRQYKATGIPILKFTSYFTPILCPRCKNAIMKKYVYSESFIFSDMPNVQPGNHDFCILDECINCDSLWIDSGDVWFIKKYGSNILHAPQSGEQKPDIRLRGACTWGLYKTGNGCSN